MQPASKKLKIIALIVSIAFSIFSCGILLLGTIVSYSTGARPSPISPNALAFLKGSLIFMSAYGFAVAWLFQFPRVPLVNILRNRRGEAVVLLMSHTLLISPDIYGLLLYYCGMPIHEYFYFVGASIVMTLALGFYDLRKT